MRKRRWSNPGVVSFQTAKVRDDHADPAVGERRAQAFGKHDLHVAAPFRRQLAGRDIVVVFDGPAEALQLGECGVFERDSVNADIVQSRRSIDDDFRKTER